MTPRLTKFGRESHAFKMNRHILKTKYGGHLTPVHASRPSPAERLRQRRKARVAVMRSLDRRDDVDLTLAYMVGRGDRQWPQSRGTTTSQLVAMHLEAEENKEPT